MKIPVRGEVLLSKEQKDAIANKIDQARRSARFLMGDGDFNNEERTDRLAKAIARNNGEIIKQEEMSNQQNTQIYENAKEKTVDDLSEAIHRTRQEIGGVSIEEVAELFFVHYDQTETKSLIDQLVLIHGKKWGERLFP